MQFSDLPTEIYLELVKYLTVPDLISISQTCQLFREICTDDSWKSCKVIGCTNSNPDIYSRLIPLTFLKSGSEQVRKYVRKDLIEHLEFESSVLYSSTGQRRRISADGRRVGVSDDNLLTSFMLKNVIPSLFPRLKTVGVAKKLRLYVDSLFSENFHQQIESSSFYSFEMFDFGIEYYLPIQRLARNVVNPFVSHTMVPIDQNVFCKQNAVTLTIDSYTSSFLFVPNITRITTRSSSLTDLNIQMVHSQLSTFGNIELLKIDLENTSTIHQLLNIIVNQDFQNIKRIQLSVPIERSLDGKFYIWDGINILNHSFFGALEDFSVAFYSNFLSNTFTNTSNNDGTNTNSTNSDLIPLTPNPQYKLFLQHVTQLDCTRLLKTGLGAVMSSISFPKVISLITDPEPYTPPKTILNQLTSISIHNGISNLYQIVNFVNWIPDLKSLGKLDVDLSAFPSTFELKSMRLTNALVSNDIETVNKCLVNFSETVRSFIGTHLPEFVELAINKVKKAEASDSSTTTNFSANDIITELNYYMLQHLLQSLATLSSLTCLSLQFSVYYLTQLESQLLELVNTHPRLRELEVIGRLKVKGRIARFEHSESSISLDDRSVEEVNTDLEPGSFEFNQQEMNKTIKLLSHIPHSILSTPVDNISCLSQGRRSVRQGLQSLPSANEMSNNKKMKKCQVDWVSQTIFYPHLKKL